jgi:hypothetical protein
MSCLEFSASASHCLYTDSPGEGYLRFSDATEKVRCIVRKLPSKRKLNSSSQRITAADQGSRDGCMGTPDCIPFAIDALWGLCYGDHRRRRE